MEFSDGLVLRLVPFGEADQVATLYTRAHGRIGALARGARRSQRRFGGALGHLVVSQLALKPRTRGDLWTLESAQVIHDFTALAADVAAFAHAGYATELLLSLTPAEVPEPTLLELVVALHEALRAGASASVLRAFELHFLDTLGSAPVLDACARCGRSDELDAGGVVFDPERGGVICPRCAADSRGPAVRPLPPGGRALLLAARAADDLDVARTLDDPDEVARVDHAAARDAMISMITHLVGRPLRSVEFITKLQAAARSKLDP